MSRGCSGKWLNPSLEPHSAGVVMVGGGSGRRSFVVGGAGLGVSVVVCSVASNSSPQGKTRCFVSCCYPLGRVAKFFSPSAIV